jgi:pimeloyl-ACP methyl ester carboxylesterase
MTPGDVPIETSSIFSGEFSTCYRSAGHGDPLILLHGAGGDSSMFEGTLAMMAEHRRVIAPDILGHGRSRGPAGWYTASAYCRWLDFFLSGLKIGPVDPAGHSMGGAIALRFAARRPALVRHLILIDPISLRMPDIRSTLRLLAAVFSTKPQQALNLVAQVMFSSNSPPSEGSNAWTQLRSAEIPR